MAVGIIFTVVLIVFDIIFHFKGVPNYCYVITKTVECNVVDAVFSRVGFFIVFTLVFGIPIGIVGALLGFFINKISLK